jgi:hypothetical protein
MKYAACNKELLKMKAIPPFGWRTSLPAGHDAYQQQQQQQQLLLLRESSEEEQNRPSLLNLLR